LLICTQSLLSVVQSRESGREEMMYVALLLQEGIIISISIKNVVGLERLNAVFIESKRIIAGWHETCTAFRPHEAVWQTA